MLMSCLLLGVVVVGAAMVYAEEDPFDGSLEDTLRALQAAARADGVAEADPGMPVWPPHFSTSVVIRDNRLPPHDNPVFGRYFMDRKMQSDRFDTALTFAGERVFSERIWVKPTQKEWSVIFSEDVVQCFVSKLNATHQLPDPHFELYTYAGETLVSGQDCYHWFVASPDNRLLVQYYDNKESRRPVRFQIINQDGRPQPHNIRYTFMEFNYGPVDKYLFVVPEPIRSTCSHLPPSRASGASESTMLAIELMNRLGNLL